jgi:PAS domain S-box-containing protein
MVAGEPVVVNAGAERAVLNLLDDVRGRRVDELAAVRDAAAGDVDCVLAGTGLDGATPVDVLRAVRAVDAELPVVVWPDDVDGDAARAAVSHDATAYLPDADVETVGERVRASVDAPNADRPHEQLRAAVESVHDQVFVLDDDATLSLVTDTLAARIGRRREALLGAGLDALLSPDGVARGLALVNDLLAGADGASYETELAPADGDPVPVEVELSLLGGESTFDGIVGVVHDRTEIERTRRELEAARERFSYLFEHIPDAVVETEYVDGEPIVRGVNPAFEELFGYDPDAVVGESLDDYVMTQDMRAEANEVDRRTRAGEEFVDRVRRWTADGIRDFLIRSVPYATNGDAVRAYFIYTDVTERTERERRLSVLTNVLRHNLRTEMNLVLGHADAILERYPNDDVKDLVAELRRSAETVVDMGETARDIEALVERTWGTDQSVDLVGLVEGVASRLAESHPRATVRTDLPESAAVRGDEAIERAVHELVENAVVHHGGDPSVEVTVRRVDEKWTDLRVADDGPGIPTFERELVSGQRDVSQLEHGNGLGLWIARWTAESLGGSLTLLDREPRGTVARLRLRAAQQAATGTRLRQS